MMKRIAIDMDEVITDFNGKFIPVFNSLFGEKLSRESLNGTTAQQLYPDLAESIEEIIGEANFFSDLPVIPDSQRVIKKLNEHYEIFITTAAMEFPLSFNAKFSWLQNHFPFISPQNIVFCGDKSIINADYLIDDNPRHFKLFRGEGILFTAPHNLNSTGYNRVDSWEEIEHIFEK